MFNIKRLSCCPVSRHRFIVIKGLPLKDYSAVIGPKICFLKGIRSIFLWQVWLRGGSGVTADNVGFLCGVVFQGNAVEPPDALKIFIGHLDFAEDGVADSYRVIADFKNGDAVVEQKSVLYHRKRNACSA